MKRLATLVGIPAVTLVIGLIAGAALGQRQGIAMMTKMMEAETSGMLSLHVEAASSIRVGDDARALKLLDSVIDTGAVALRARPATSRSGGALDDATAYRTVVPVSDSVRGPQRQGSALQELMTRSRR